MVDSKTDEVLLFPGDVTLAVMLGGFFVLILTGTLQKSPTDFDYINGISAAALCRFLITRVYLCLKTVYGARGN